MAAQTAITLPVPEFLVIGDAFLDVQCGGLAQLPRWDADELVPRPIEFLAGGGGLNTACHLARAGRRVELRCALGDDDAGAKLRSAAADCIVARENRHGETVREGGKRAIPFVAEPNEGEAAQRRESRGHEPRRLCRGGLSCSPHADRTRDVERWASSSDSIGCNEPPPHKWPVSIRVAHALTHDA